mgnify:FL=1
MPTAASRQDTHGARDQWMCVFVYEVDNESQPAVARGPLTFTEVYLGQVVIDKEGIEKLRKNWIYRG